MKHYEDLARLRVNNALQTGVKVQAVNRRLGKRKQTRKAIGGIFEQLWRIMVGQAPISRRANPVAPDRPLQKPDVSAKMFRDDDAIDTGVTQGG